MSSFFTLRVFQGTTDSAEELIEVTRIKKLALVSLLSSGDQA
jgi:hypothetical protein